MSIYIDFPAEPAPIVRRLGVRLQHLYHWAEAAGPFADIWDLCCDHGRLGLHIYQAQRGAPPSQRSRVHLNDCVPHIIEKLQHGYAEWMGEHLSIECRDAGDIVLPESGRQLIVLAGVGGVTIAGILRSLLFRNETQQLPPIDLLLSPNRHAFDLRLFLREHPFVLLQEAFVTEKGSHHEHLHLRLHASGEKPSLVGEALWQPLTSDKRDYIKAQIGHYRNRVALGGQGEYQLAVEAYEGLLRPEPDLG